MYLRDFSRYPSENDDSENVTPTRKLRVVMNESLFELTKRLVNENVQAKEIMRLTQLSKPAVYKAINKIGENPNASFNEQYSRPGRNKSNHDELVCKIKDIIDENQSLTQNGIKIKLESNFQQDIKQPLFSKLLKRNKFSSNRLKKKAAVVSTESHQKTIIDYAHN